MTIWTRRLPFVAVLLVPLCGCGIVVAGGELQQANLAVKKQDDESLQQASVLFDSLSEGTTPDDYRAKTMEYFHQFLKDPYSAHIKIILLRGPVVCGVVNAKNSYGAYTGAQEFYVVFNKSGEIARASVLDGAEKQILWYASLPDGGASMLDADERVNVMFFETCSLAAMHP